MRRALAVLSASFLVGCSAVLSPPLGNQTVTPTPPSFSGDGPRGATVQAEVVDIVDGDTIKVQLDGNVQSLRYIGIDSPERGQPGASAATSANARLVEGQVVTLEKDVSETDRYGRLLRYVWIQQAGSWLMVNRALVRQGHAIAKAYPPDTRYQALFGRAQKAAMANHVGIWAGQIHTLVPPESTPRPHRKNCDAAYPTVCIPPYPPDLDCGDIPYRDFKVLPPDPHGFDAEGDGYGCES